MIKNQALGGRSSKGLIFLGLFLGLVSAALVVVYLSQANEGGGDVSGAATTDVVVAKSDIAAGLRITEEMVELKPISSDAVLATAFTDTENVIGQVARVPLVAGEQLLPTKVAGTGVAIPDVENPPLAYVIPEGKRAVSVAVSGVIGASGLIRPGDYVDVILTVKLDSSQEGEGTSAGAHTRDQFAVTILQNVQVLSIDQNVALTGLNEGGEGAPPVSEPASEEDDTNPEAATVTLAVSPAHGEVLTVAEACGENFDGRLALALRGIGDSGAVQTRSVWPESGGPPSCAALLGISSLQ